MKSNKLQFNKQFLKDIELDENKLYYKKSILNYILNKYDLVNKYCFLLLPDHVLYKYKLCNHNYIYSCHIIKIINNQISTNNVTF
tara:strand:+ start:1478 stop:1732 length:255 start_codon:yes stop_codon:yes gene_type:complete